jgi:ankyrin repeat protein
VEDVEHGKLIFEASRHGNVREVELLLRRGVNYGLTALHAAAFKGHKNVALMLSEVGLDLECEDDEGNVPLHMAVESGDIETVRVFVGKGVNLNAMNKRGVTPLYMARVWGYEDVCQLLVSKGALSTLSLTSA